MGLVEGWGSGVGGGRITVIEYSEDTSELSRHCPLEIFFQVFGFKEVCRVSAAKLFLVSSPATGNSTSFVSDARLHQLQPWLQLLIKLLVVTGQKCSNQTPFKNRPLLAMLSDVLVY